ncbi:MAG: peptidoglycan-binding protein [Propionibacteriaceae bacterium]|jgi:peptidoglycan hydrolase-like protein with peptidoglycan-binding domain|nr:peptidoglycan-binding protein [Propionibacteriaceae bacterium]
MRNSIRVAASWVLSCALVGAACFWAGTQTLAPPKVEDSDVVQESVVVQEGALGRSLSVPVLASWELVPNGAATREGTLTTIDFKANKKVKEGAKLFTIDLRPTAALTGKIPSHRDLSEGAKGEDVSQLQRFLVDRGYLSQVSGSFDRATTYAVKTWQKTLGMEPDGLVFSSDVVFFPKLPTRIVLAKDLRVGSHIAAGTELVSMAAAQPRFRAQLSADQLAILGEEKGISVRSGKDEWEGVLSQPEKGVDNTDTIWMEVSAPDGSALCAKKCDSIPMLSEGSNVLAGKIVVVPDTSGAMLPASSVLTDAGGETFVLQADGTRTPVKVLVTQDGQSIVDGIEIGARVLVSPKE